MNRAELEQLIQRLGLSEYQYNLGTRPIRELELCLKHENNKWIVFRALERGGDHIIEEFNNESDACEMILDFLLSEQKIDKYFEEQRKKQQ